MSAIYRVYAISGSSDWIECTTAREAYRQAHRAARLLRRLSCGSSWWYTRVYDGENAEFRVWPITRTVFADGTATRNQ